MQLTTKPHLGTNMYAADREKPPVPLKLNEPEDSALEEARVKKAEADAKMAKSLHPLAEEGEVVT